MIFGNVNLDLMYALPRADARRSAGATSPTALAFAPPHLSFYHLTLEPNTLFHRDPPPLPDDDAGGRHRGRLHERSRARAIEHYEISAYASRVAQCRHNLNYWRFGDYLGIGAGAHSKLSFPDRIVRQVRCKQPTQYLEQVARAARRCRRNARSRARDLGVRVHAERAAPRPTASPLGSLRSAPVSRSRSCRPLAVAEARGLLERDPATIRPTALGRRFLNDLQQLFLKP